MNRDQLIASFLKASSPKPIRLDVDELGTVFVRVMTAYDADVARKSLEATKKDDGCDVGRLLANMVCDEDGALLFEATSPESVLMLSKLPPKVQTALLNAANQANSADPK